MMAHALSGLHRSETAGAQAALLDGSAGSSALQADFAALLQQGTDATPAASELSLVKQVKDLPTSVDPLKVPVNRPADFISGLNHAAAVTRAFPLAKGVVPEVTPQSMSNALIPATDKLGNDTTLKAAPRVDTPRLEQQSDLPLIAPAAVTSSLSHALDPVSKQKPASGMTIPSAVVKLVAKDLKPITKQVAPAVTMQATPLVADVARPLTVPEGVLAAMAPAGQEGTVAPVKDKSLLHFAPSPQRGMPEGTSPAALRNEQALTSEIVPSNPTINTLTPVTATDDRTSATITGSVDDSRIVTGGGVLARPVALEVRRPQAPERQGIIELASLRENGPDASNPAYIQEGSLPHTLLSSTSTTLEVGVNGGAHGWLKIRAELTKSGEVTASLGGASPSTASVLRSELPALNSYLLAEKIQVGTLSVHTMLSSMNELPNSAESGRHGGSSDLSGGLSGGSEQAGTPDERGQRALPSIESAENADNSQLDASSAKGAYASEIGLGGSRALSPLEYGADGSWLNVRV